MNTEVTMSSSSSLSSSSSYDFGVSGATSSGNIFGVSNGDSLNANVTSFASSSSSSSSSQRFNYSMLPSTTDPNKFFSLSSGSQLMHDLNKPYVPTLTDFLQSGSPAKPEKSIGGLATDLAAEVTHLGKLKTAMDIGEGLHKVAKKIDESKELQSAICDTAQVVVEGVTDAAIKGRIVGGTLLFLEEAAVFPPLALGIPFVADAVPKAYANAGEVAKFAGEKAKAECELLFKGPN